MKSTWYSALTQSENIVALFFLSREADFSTCVSKSVFPLLKVSMTPVIIVYYGPPSKIKSDNVGKATLTIREK